MAPIARSFSAIVGTLIVTAVAGGAASARAVDTPDFTLQLVRSSLSDSGETVSLQGTISAAASARGLRPRILVAATVSQPCQPTDGAPAVAGAILDSATASHFFTTTLRFLDSRSDLIPWRATVTLTLEPDATICPADEQPASAVSIEGSTGVAYLSSTGLGSPVTGSLYPFVLVAGHQTLPPARLTPSP